MRLFLLPLLILLPSPLWGAESAMNPGVISSSLRVVGGLVLVVGLLLLVYALLKKRGGLLPGQKNGQIKILETRHLAPKKSVALLEVRGRQLLVGIGVESISLLCQLDEKPSGNFAAELEQQLERQS